LHCHVSAYLSLKWNNALATPKNHNNFFLTNWNLVKFESAIDRPATSHLQTHPDTQANFTRLASFIALTKSDTIQRVLFSIPAVPFKEPIPAYSPSVLSVST
jgi:hypothetical protein